MDVAQLLAVWLHTLAFVIAWDGPAQAAALVAIERRALPLVLLSMALFLATGTCLLFIDPRYAGLGDFFANTWTTLMLIKHLVVVVLIALGVAVDLFVRRVGEATDEVARRWALRRTRLSAEGATGIGALIVLLTAAAQLSA
jgi:uncharacterized membrane protein